MARGYKINTGKGAIYDKGNSVNEIKYNSKMNFLLKALAKE